MARYNAKENELKWQAVWAENRTFEVSENADQEKYYVLEMFPYPSGRIHMGHVRNYTLGDVIARYKRARGFNVMHPMGWDAFGLPAENAARDKGIHPAEWTYANIANMRDELKSMGLSLDWTREIATCHPGYYAPQQRLFIDLFKEELGMTDDDIIRMPGIFEEYPQCGGATLALIPGTINMLVAPRDDGRIQLYMADPFFRAEGQGQEDDPFIAEIEALLPPGMETYWLDDWDAYHIMMGEVHCGTNARRTPTDDWWTSAAHLLEDN